MLATAHASVRSGYWSCYEFSLTPQTDASGARFELSLATPGTVDVGYVFLSPGDWGMYKGLPVRKDVAEALIGQGITAMRYGGSMVNTSTYRWKPMIGPRDRRQPYDGHWYDYSTHGWAIFDFLNFT